MVLTIHPKINKYLSLCQLAEIMNYFFILNTKISILIEPKHYHIIFSARTCKLTPSHISISPS